MKKNIAVIGGGNSSEYEVSLQSAAHVFAEIDGERYNKYLLILKGRDWHIEENGTQYPVDKNDFSFTRNGEKVCFDYAYIIIHGNPKNVLLKQAACSICFRNEETNSKFGSFASRVVKQYILDVLYSTIFSLDYEKNVELVHRYAG